MVEFVGPALELPAHTNRSQAPSLLVRPIKPSCLQANSELVIHVIVATEAKVSGAVAEWKERVKAGVYVDAVVGLAVPGVKREVGRHGQIAANEKPESIDADCRIGTVKVVGVFP